MTKKTHILYSVISICAIIAYTGFLIKNSISEVDTVEETLPYETHENFLENETATLPELSEVNHAQSHIPDVSPTEITEEPTIEAVTEFKEIVGFSPLFPVSGSVTKHFSLKHVYNPDTKDWRAHSGIDIAAAPAEAVVSVEDGTVTACYSDPLWGNVIEVAHGEYVSIYKNVSTLIMVKEGDSVARGEKISGVGNTSVAETGDAHIHFELKHYSEYVDPLEHLG